MRRRWRLPRRSKHGWPISAIAASTSRPCTTADDQWHVLPIERAHTLFDRERHHEGMLWLARALESIPPDSLDLDRAVRTSLGGWRAEGKLLERTLAHKGLVHSSIFAPDGRRLATACSDGTARLWDVAKGTPLSTPMAHDRRGASDRVQSRRKFDRDGERRRNDQAVGCDDGWSHRQPRPARGAR